MDFSDLSNVVFLDTETTGLDNADAIEIAVVSLNESGEKSYLFNSRIKTKKKIGDKAFAVHNISKKDLKNAPRFIDVYDKLKEILNDKLVVIYNKSFDRHIINNMCFDINKEALLKFDNCFCLMEKYAEYYDDYNDYFDSYTWKKLTTAFDEEKDNVDIIEDDKVNIKEHTALGDCLMSKYVFLSLHKRGEIE